MIDSQRGMGRHARPRRRWPAAAAAALAALVFGAAVVSAHVQLVGTSPQADARLPAPPGEIAVWFDGAVDPAASGLLLLDRAGREVARARGTAPGTRDRLLLAPPPLAAGTYTVVWEVVSVSDNHPDSGFHAFSVGEPSPPLQVGINPAQQQVRSATIRLGVTAADEGRQWFEATVLDGRGTALADVLRVQLRLRLQQPAVGPAIVTLAPQGGGRYAAASSLPSAAGRYNAEVQVRVRRADDLVARFTLDASAPPQPEPTATPAAAPTPTPVPTTVPTPVGSDAAPPAAPSGGTVAPEGE